MKKVIFLFAIALTFACNTETSETIILEEEILQPELITDNDGTDPLNTDTTVVDTTNVVAELNDGLTESNM